MFVVLSIIINNIFVTFVSVHATLFLHLYISYDINKFFLWISVWSYVDTYQDPHTVELKRFE